MERHFKVIRQLSREELNEYSVNNATIHLSKERQDRIDKYSASGNKFLDGFEVDTAHENGHEAHIIDDEGYIHIFNIRTKKYITSLSGRKPQIERYYKQLKLDVPNEVQVAILFAYYKNRYQDYNHI